MENKYEIGEEVIFYYDFKKEFIKGKIETITMATNYVKYSIRHRATILNIPTSESDVEEKHIFSKDTNLEKLNKEVKKIIEEREKACEEAVEEAKVKFNKLLEENNGK